MVPASDPNSGPALVQIFSLQSAVSYAFWMSQARIFRSFLSAAMVNAILTELRETTDAYVSVLSTYVV
jgi:hypothetical protein